MKGINLNKEVTYEYASFRYFEKNEYHVERFCESDVLLLVFDGILRFSEDCKFRPIGVNLSLQTV